MTDPTDNRAQNLDLAEKLCEALPKAAELVEDSCQAMGEEVLALRQANRVARALRDVVGGTDVHDRTIGDWPATEASALTLIEMLRACLSRAHRKTDKSCRLINEAHEVLYEARPNAPGEAQGEEKGPW